MIKLLHGHNVYLIVTSRITLPAPAALAHPLRAMEASQQVALAPLPLAAAKQLLRIKCPGLSDTQAAAIAAVCECNALLLQLLGSFLQRRRVRVEVH